MDCTFEPYPAVGAARDPDAYMAAIDALPPKSAITIFVSQIVLQRISGLSLKGTAAVPERGNALGKIAEADCFLFS